MHQVASPVRAGRQALVAVGGLENAEGSKNKTFITLQCYTGRIILELSHYF